MAVYYKFKSAKDYDSILIEGQFISVGTLKERIFESKHLGRGTDFDLMISNAQSNEEYVDEAAMIPKNTSVLIRRVPGCPRKPIVTEPEEPKITKAAELPPLSSMLVGDYSGTMKNEEESKWDEFGNDLYAIPDVTRTQLGNPGVDASAASKIDEENKIKALVETPALDWSRQGQDVFGGDRGFGRGMGGRVMSRRGFGRGGFERKTPPVGYICHRCKVPGHFIQHCPTNGDPNYDTRKVKPPTGIPRSMLMATPDGSYALPSGAVAVLKPNEAAFEKEIEGMPSTSARPVSDLPPELRCPLCKEVMKDAVFTSKCCFRSFCDKCIREYIISKSICVCGATNILADDLLPNKTLRETISRILESTSSTENVESLVHGQDMESARHVPPQIPSPARSAASKDESKQMPPVQQSSDVKVGSGKEADAVSEGKTVNIRVHSLEKKAVKITDQSEVMPEPMSAREPTCPESAPVPEDVQGKLVGGEQGKKKKKKKARVLGSAADMQWRGFQDLGADNYAGMPLGPAAYNSYWGWGIQMGVDGFMAPFGGAMPYMGYAPGSFNVPFGGMLPLDPFAAQGYMMPPLPPRDLSELGFNSMNMNKAPPMSREEFEAVKADIRRKRELKDLKQHNERDYSKDGRGAGKEVSSSAVDVSLKKAKPQRPMSKADPHDRAETTLDPDRHRDSPYHSPPTVPRPSSQRRFSDHDERERKVEDKAAAAEQLDKYDRKLKVSVFSRISFADSEKETKKRKTSLSTAAAAAAANGVVSDHHRHRSHHRDRDEAVSQRASSVTYKRSSYEHESGEEEEDEDYHFKRRPSKREREREDEGRSSRNLRERETKQT